MDRIEENLTAFLTVFFRGLFSLMGVLMILLLKIALAICIITCSFTFFALLAGFCGKTNDDEEDDLLRDQIGSDPEAGVNSFTGEQDSGLNPNGCYK